MSSVYFPKLNGGEEIGFNDAGIEQFKHDRIESLMRECTQNSTDALDKRYQTQKVKIRFELISIAKNDIPGINELKKHLELCLQRVSSPEVEKNEKKSQKFFSKALEIISNEKIPCLLIRDYQTTGLPGQDDDRTGKWHSLVKAKGSSNKSSETAGGSFGIGKSAPFACSALRTVIYSTRFDGGCAMQGKSILISHKDADGDLTQGVGFIGNLEKNNCLAIRDESKIPPYLKRNANGTDILIIGFNENDWKEKIKLAALEHFWPALELDKVEFEIKDFKQDVYELNKANLDSELLKISEEKMQKKILYFLDAFRTGEKKLSHIKNAGECNLYFKLSDGWEDYSNKVCCFRNNAMVIEYMSIQTGGNFNGIFYCDNEIGSKVFREMEPPRHDQWTPNQPQDEEDQKKCKETYASMREKLREFLEEIISKNINESVSPDELELNVDSSGNSELNSDDSLEPVQISHELKSKKPIIIKPLKRKPGPSNPGEEIKPKNKSNPLPKIIYPSIRCFLKNRDVNHCTYCFNIPKNIDTNKVYKILVHAIGYDGNEIEVNILDPQNQLLQVRPEITETEIKILGEPLSIYAILETQ